MATGSGPGSKFPFVFNANSYRGPMAGCSGTRASGGRMASVHQPWWRRSCSEGPDEYQIAQRLSLALPKHLEHNSPKVALRQAAAHPDDWRPPPNGTDANKTAPCWHQGRKEMPSAARFLWRRAGTAQARRPICCSTRRWVL